VLETVVSNLESSQVALDDSIILYERGDVLKKHCEKKLKEAEEKVAQITLSPDGKPEGLKPVEG
jgi:exodeoxyribonuclease VII small subunit